MSEIEQFELPPDPERVMVGLRDTGYEFDTAVIGIKGKDDDYGDIVAALNRSPSKRAGK